MGNKEAMMDVLTRPMERGTRIGDHVMNFGTIYGVLKANVVDFNIQYAQSLLVYTLPLEWEDYGVNLISRNPPLTFEEIAKNLEQEELDREIRLLESNSSEGR
ncbi:hypothetical protein AMTR_s00053p00228260 [Amborella trichopoda]|uniref:Uncharacterized protein n=1 Tax=Amborella trichopoda TaxID=13333 RepID=W1P5R1_AMBTC|nr:hypothetical protein AMTR_s00053p00228260 [Amborella trichopoda]